MFEISGNYGKVIFCDCLDPKHGLPSLKREFDATITDPPYGLGYTSGRTTEKETITYDDPHEGYYDNCKSWFNEVSKISKMVIFTPGNPNLHFWYNFKKPKDLGFHYKCNSCSRADAAKFATFEAILFYGNFKDNKVNHLIFNYPNSLTRFKHPCPKTYKFWEALISELEPESVLDPFLGSGTTAEVCEMLGIEWLAYEIKKEYSVDIEKRIDKGIKKNEYLNENTGDFLEI